MNEGTIEPSKWIQTHIARVLLQLERGKRTGALHITAGSQSTQLVIVEGHVVFAEAAEDCSLLFGRLVDEGALEPIGARRIERRVSEARGWSGLMRGAELVIQDARVAPNVLQQALLATIRARVCAVLRISEGTWVFREDARATGVPRYPVALESTLVEALAERNTAAQLRELLRGVGSRFPRLEKESGVGTTKYLLTPSRYRVLRLVDGTRSLDEILQQSALGADEGASLIAAFTMLERIWWATERTAAPVLGDSSPEGRRPATIERPGTAIRAVASPIQARPSSSPPGTAAKAPPSAPVDVNELLRRLRPRTRSGEAEAQPVSALGHFERGKVHFGAGRHAVAAAEFEKAASLEPTNANYVLHARFLAFSVASAAHRVGLEGELTELAMRRAKEDKMDAFALHVLGRLAFEKDDHERAIKAFKAAERLAPQDAENTRYLRLVTARVKR